MTTTSARPASSRRNSFARSAVYLEFRGRDARHLDQAGFIDRAPDQAPRRHIEADAVGALALDQLAATLRQVGDDDSQTAGV